MNTNRHRRAIALASIVVVLGSAGCSDRGAKGDQAVSKYASQPSWDAAADPFVAPGWKSGDKASWQEQMTSRAQSQNEYVRIR